MGTKWNSGSPFWVFTHIHSFSFWFSPDNFSALGDQGHPQAHWLIPLLLPWVDLGLEMNFGWYQRTYAWDIWRGWGSSFIGRDEELVFSSTGCSHLENKSVLLWRQWGAWGWQRVGMALRLSGRISPMWSYPTLGLLWFESINLLYCLCHLQFIIAVKIIVIVRLWSTCLYS